MSDAQSPPPALFDFALADALRRARHAALLGLMPSLQGRGWTEPKFQLLHALVRAGEPLAQGVAAERAGLHFCAVRFHIARLIEDGFIAWAPPPRRQHPYIVARDIGRRQINHIAREVAARMSNEQGHRGDWNALAALPEDVCITPRMCARLFELMDKLRRASAGEAMKSGANAPAGLPEPDELAAFSLALQARRARSALVKRFGKVLRHYDLSEAQWRILRIVTAQPSIGWPRRAIERRGCFHFSDPVVQRGLFYLSQRGLIDKDDRSVRPLPYRTLRWGPRRQFNALATRAGQDMIARIEARERDTCAEMFERLEMREMIQLDRLLARVTQALLWRIGAAPEDQDAHPLAAHYRRFEAQVSEAAHAFERENKQRREAGLPVRRRERMTHWWA